MISETFCVIRGAHFDTGVAVGDLAGSMGSNDRKIKGAVENALYQKLETGKNSKKDSSDIQDRIINYRKQENTDQK
ncbi:hypothetical protein B9Z55_013220 [Caenorhabditis nigoni]|uniref:Uncharacterized protein n=1 Tax=Caenorhabditis nigoni TaxID=1611254 RepID=A0A2G5U0Q6_9PELO|nr:hypothetical protein B9Z55_013220 [Caenorhabditis nigoni]